MALKEFVKRLPVVGRLARRAARALHGPGPTRPRGTAAPAPPFPGSAAYWEQRYAAGGDSGVGSYALFADFKAEVLNEFVERHAVASVIEFGCGDGNQLALAAYPRYLGLDVSPTAIEHCRERFRGDAGKRFLHVDEYAGEQAELALSLDVIYHLIEDAVFAQYMGSLFSAASRFVIVYASDSDDNSGLAGTQHVKHRKFSRWVQEHAPHWVLQERIPNRYPYRGDHRSGSFADFFVYQKS